MANILDGNQLAQDFKHEIAQKISQSRQNGQRAPGLAVILVGDDPASSVYVGKKRQACEAVGIFSLMHHFPSDTHTSELTQTIDHLNQREDIDGILVQLPLPEHLDSDLILQRIHPAKDVDGLHPLNIGLLATRKPAIRPCTPMGIMRLLETTDKPIKGQHAVIVGASNIVGRPMALELLLAGCTVTICHKFTQDLQYQVAQAEILVVATGKPGLIPGHWVRENAIVIDVGINRTDSGKLIGDIDFDTAQQKASWITPVPGGVGPMTVAMLLHNTLQSAQQDHLRQDHARQSSE